jgi:hypothetical protein
MKVEHLKRLPVLILTLSFALISAAPAFAARPYFKTFGGDVMTGGWYENGATCSTAAPYQNPSTPPANDFTGGILAFAKTIGASGKPDGGASSQYGVISIGKVDGDNTVHGFYSAGAEVNNSTRVDYTTFANTNPGRAPWGGLFEGSVSQSNCIPDYYGQKPSNVQTVPPNNSLSDLISIGNDSYAITPPVGTNYDLTASGPVTVDAGKKINIYVDGSVYIGNNITYGASTADNVPKFRIVAKGSIYIGPGVTNLDGWYVAQPQGNGGTVVDDDDGVIWTCHVNDQGKPTDIFIVGSCGNKLTVNGAVTAKAFNLYRMKGDLAGASSAEDEPNGLATSLASGNIAEIFNYTPAMVIGGSFLNTTSGGGGGALPYDSLISLPPVF